MTQPHTIQHREEPGGGAFFIEHEGARIAELTYAVNGKHAIADHTWVDPKFRGGSLARDLVEALAAWARAGGHRIEARCTYVRGVFARDERYSDLRG